MADGWNVVGLSFRLSCIVLFPVDLQTSMPIDEGAHRCGIDFFHIVCAARCTVPSTFLPESLLKLSKISTSF